MHEQLSGDNSLAITETLTAIATEKEKLAKSEGSVIVAIIQIGLQVLTLRSLASRNWAKWLQTPAINMSRRVASRYLKIAAGWSAEMGLLESHLDRLPTDLLKLEWLCRVPIGQLPDLLDGLNCKQATRKQVIAAVREALDEPSPTTAPLDVDRAVGRFLERLAGKVARLLDRFLQTDQQDRARALLAAGFSYARQGLEAQPVEQEQSASVGEEVCC